MKETPTDSSEVRLLHFPDFGDRADELRVGAESGGAPGRSRLRVEYGRIDVLRDEIAEWKSGTTIVLPQLHADPVAIYIDSELVALGELVERKGRMGVRILSLFQGETNCKMAADDGKHSVIRHSA